MHTPSYPHDDQVVQVGRRAFLKGGVLTLGAIHLTAHSLLSQKPTSVVKVGMVTDMHYADKSPAGSRHYRETLGKLEVAAKKFEEAKPEFIVELGDFIDAANSVDTEKSYLKTIQHEFSQICPERHYVLGNHCVDTLTKAEFLGGVEQEKSYYSFDKDHVHFVVLDACFRGDGTPYQRKNFKWTDPNIPDHELEWLAADLKATDKHVIVFAHQRLDVSNNHGVKNNGKVREILEQHEQVLAVFQGHSHKNDLKELNGIHYCTLKAMVEGAGLDNNGYSLMDIDSDGTIQLSGFQKQTSYSWK